MNSNMFEIIGEHHENLVSFRNLTMLSCEFYSRLSERIHPILWIRVVAISLDGSSELYRWSIFHWVRKICFWMFWNYNNRKSLNFENSSFLINSSSTGLQKTCLRAKNLSTRHFSIVFSLFQLHQKKWHTSFAYSPCTRAKHSFLKVETLWKALISAPVGRNVRQKAYRTALRWTASRPWNFPPACGLCILQFALLLDDENLR